MLKAQMDADPAITYQNLMTAIKAEKKAKQEERKNLDTKWHGDMNINAEAKKIWKMLEPWHKGKPLPPVHIVQHTGRGRVGWAHVSQQWKGIYVKKTSNQIDFWTTLLHELTHMAVGSRRNDNGGRCWHDRDFYMAMREVTQNRWKCKISYAKVGKWGYDVDKIIRVQLKEQDAIKLKPRKVSVVDAKIELVLEGSNA
jgi:hypothetical protein